MQSTASIPQYGEKAMDTPEDHEEREPRPTDSADSGGSALDHALARRSDPASDVVMGFAHGSQ